MWLPVNSCGVGAGGTVAIAGAGVATGSGATVGAAVACAVGCGLVTCGAATGAVCVTVLPISRPKTSTTTVTAAKIHRRAIPIRGRNRRPADRKNVSAGSRLRGIP